MASKSSKFSASTKKMNHAKGAKMTKTPTYLASLREAKLLYATDSKAALPMEIIDLVLEFLTIPDLMRFARTSRRMQEMVYDDTRWVQKLKLLGMWNENEARQRSEESMKKRIEVQKLHESEDIRRSEEKGGVNGANGQLQKVSQTLFDAGWEEQKHYSAAASPSINLKNMSSKVNGFAAPSLPDTKVALIVLKNVKSIRGHAREEYGKVYRTLAHLYMDMEQSTSHADARLFRIYTDPEEQAIMLNQLHIFARGDVRPGWRRRVDSLESMVAVFENAVLREFENAYKSSDINGGMIRYARVLVALNGGAAAIDLYIHNHRLMADRDKLGNPLDCLDVIGQANLLPSSAFFQRLVLALNEESDIIERVFPASVDVLVPFIGRLCEDVVTPYITPLFDEAHQGSRETYLKIVAGVFEQSQRFVKSLVPPKGSTEEFLPRAERLVNKCFEPHVDLYLQEELEFFVARSNQEVQSWEKRLSEQEASSESFFMSNVSRQAEKRDFMTSFKKVLMAPVNVLPTIPIGSAFSGSSTAKTLGAPEITNESTLPQPTTFEEKSLVVRSEAPTTELAAKTAIMNAKLEGIGSLFSIEVALNLVHMAKASTERAARFVQLGGQLGVEAKEQCELLFVHMLQTLGSRHIKPGFDKAIDHLSKYNARQVSEHSKGGVKPLITFLELVNVGDLILQMIEVFFVQELVGNRLADRDDFLDPAVKEKKQFEKVIDERVAAGLSKGIDVLMDEIEWICATTQVTADFNPEAVRDEKQIFDIGPTTTAQTVVELVSRHTSMLVGTIDKNILEVFDQEVGLRLFSVICKHLKRQRISTHGAIKVISDTNHYYAFIQTLKNKQLLQYFKALRELSQIFLIEPAHSKEIATIIADNDRYCGILTAEEVLEFAERRADWYQIRGKVEQAMYGMGCSVM